MKILIAKLSSRGDIMHALTMIPHLKKLCPECTIDWIVEKPFCELITNHPDINEAIILRTKVWKKALFKHKQEITEAIKNLRKKEYDVLFDLQGNSKSTIFTLLARAKEKMGFGKKTVREKINLIATNKHYNPPYISVRADCVGMMYSYFNTPMPCNIEDPEMLYKISEQDKKTINDVIAQAPTDATLFMICPQSSCENKNLSEEALVEFMKGVDQKTRSFFFFSWGSQEEKNKASRISALFPNSALLPQIDLCVLQNIIDRCDYALTMDSIPLHLAATTTTKTLSVFGPSKAVYYAPDGSHQSIQGSCPYHVEFTKWCPKMRSCSTGACIKNITGKQLLKEFEIQPKKEPVATS